MGKESAASVYKQLKAKMTVGERVLYGLPFSLLAKMAYGRLRAAISRRIISSAGSHPGAYMPAVEGQFKTILDVYEQVDPASYAEALE